MNDLSAEEKATLGNMVPSLFLFSITWSVGATCDKAGRHVFDRCARPPTLNPKPSTLTSCHSGCRARTVGQPASHG